MAADDAIDLTAAGLSSSSSSGDEYARKGRYGQVTGPAELARMLRPDSAQVSTTRSVQSRFGSGD